MSFIGEVVARLSVQKTDSLTIESAELIPQKEVQPGLLFQGKTWSEAKDLIPILFGLCPYAQSAAGFIASEFARERPFLMPIKRTWQDRYFVKMSRNTQNSSSLPAASIGWMMSLLKMHNESLKA